jgi:MFS family permease
MATTAARLPLNRYGNAWHLALSSFWFGQFFLWQPVGTVLVQAQIDKLVPHDRQGTALGILLGAGGVMAMTVPPLVGAYSDRLTTPWGRRRPIIAVGSVASLIGLAVMGTAASYVQLVAGYVIVQLFFNAAGAAYSGLVPDIVPNEQFGRASGFLATMVQVGSGAGLAVTALLIGPGGFGAIYGVIAVVILLSMVPTILAARGEGMVAVAPGPSLAAREAVIDFMRPIWTGDFGWVILTRLCISAGITSVAYFLFNFFRDVVKVDNPGQFTPTWFLVVLLTAVPFGLAAGALSDRYGRKRFVYASGALQSLVALTFVVLYPTSLTLVFAAGVFYGIGYGCYYAVDWALACDTLPDGASKAKDMGLFHVALTLPQVMVPALAGVVLDYFNRQSPNSGYRVVFSVAIVFLVLGTVLVSRIRSVR